MKTCTGCHEVKPLSEFGRERQGSEVLRARCKDCRREAKRAWKANNPERDQEHWKRWREKQPAGTLPHQRAWHDAQDPERHLAKCREWKRSHPQRTRELNKLSYERDLERSRARSRAQFHRRRLAIDGDVVTAPLIAELVAQPCVYCGRTENIEIDHIVPLARGGTHEPENLAPACRPCNRSKGAKLLWEWMGI